MKQALFAKIILASVLAFTTHCNAGQYHYDLCDQQNNPKTYTLSDFKDMPYVHQHDAFEFYQTVNTQLSRTLSASVNETDQATAFVFLMSTMIYGQLFHLITDQTLIQNNTEKAISILNSKIINSSQWLEICQFDSMSHIWMVVNTPPSTTILQNTNIHASQSSQQVGIVQLMDIINGPQLRDNVFANLWAGLYEALNNQTLAQGVTKPTDNEKLIYAASAHLLSAIYALNCCELSLTNDAALNATRQNIALYTVATGPLSWTQTEQQKTNLKNLLIHPSLLHPISLYATPNNQPMVNNIQKLFAAFTHADAETAAYTRKSESILFHTLGFSKTQDARNHLTVKKALIQASLPTIGGIGTCILAYITNTAGNGLYIGGVSVIALGIMQPILTDFLQNHCCKTYALTLDAFTLDNEIKLIAIFDAIHNKGSEPKRDQSFEIACQMISQNQNLMTANPSLIETVLTKRGKI